MIEIGGRPILWHIMKMYAAHGVNDFIICLGYKGYVIKEYFANYFLHMSDVTFDMANNRMEVHHRHAEPWRVTLVDTGESTMTGGTPAPRAGIPGARPAVSASPMATAWPTWTWRRSLPSPCPRLPGHRHGGAAPGRYGALVRNGDGGRL